MIRKLWKIIKIVNSKGLPELPPRETWPIRFLLASKELWALKAILKQIEDKPAETKREVLPTGLSGMLLYRLWQHGFYENASWDKNEKCLKLNHGGHGGILNNSSSIVQPSFNYSSTIARVVPTLEKQRLHDLAMVAQRNLALKELDQWVLNWNKEQFADDKEKWVKPILIKGGATSKLYFPDESLRLGEDIDVLMPKDMLEDFAGKRVIWATHDCVRKVLANCHFEGHQFTSILDKDYNYQNLFKATSSLEGFDTLAILNKEDNFYVLVNHFVKHRGDSTHDLIDLSFMINALNIDQSLKRFCDKKRLHVVGSLNRFCKELYRADELVDFKDKRVNLLAKKLELQVCSNFVEELRMAEPFRGIYTEGLIEGCDFTRKMFRHVFLNLEKTKMYFDNEHSKIFYVIMHISYAPLRRVAQGLFSRGIRN